MSNSIKNSKNFILKQKKIAENQIQPEIDRVDAEIRGLKSEIQSAKEEFVVAEKLYLCEMDGTCGTGDKGPGPQTAAKKVRAENLKEDWEDLKLKNGDKIKILEVQIVNFQNDKLKRFEKAEASANSLNGLLERINIAHEIAGFWVTLFITLLFMAIELTPIFFKMMLIKSPYDFMNDNIKALIKAERGIEIKYDFYKDNEGVQRDLVINHQSENLIREKVKLLQTQADLNEIVLDEWKSKENNQYKKRSVQIY